MRYLSTRNADPSSLSTPAKSHSHSHSVGTTSALPEASSESSLKRRNLSTPEEKNTDQAPEEKTANKEVGASLQLGAYLNLFADFTHNITDGLAMSAAFYASPGTVIIINSSFLSFLLLTDVVLFIRWVSHRCYYRFSLLCT